MNWKKASISQLMQIIRFEECGAEYKEIAAIELSRRVMLL